MLAAILKNRARTAYLAYNQIFDGMDCGHQMAQHVSAEAAKYAREFDECMDALAATDPACPARRLTDPKP